MPRYTYACMRGHEREIIIPTYRDRGCETLICACGETMGRTLAMGQGLCYFEEGRGRLIENMSHQPQLVTSHEQHKRLMKEHKVEWANPGRGMPGQWI